MGVQDDLLNDEKYFNQSLYEAPENTQTYSFRQDETEDMCSFRQDDARGDGGTDEQESAVIQGL